MAQATHRPIATALLVGSVSMWLWQPAAAQRAPEEHPSFLLTSPYGVDNFHAYCSPCHCRDGKGNGPVAKVLKTTPSDLTMIVARNHGVFPRATIRDIIANGSPRHPRARCRSNAGLGSDVPYTRFVRSRRAPPTGQHRRVSVVHPAMVIRSPISVLGRA